MKEWFRGVFAVLGVFARNLTFESVGSRKDVKIRKDAKRNPSSCMKASYEKQSFMVRCNPVAGYRAWRTRAVEPQQCGEESTVADSNAVLAGVSFSNFKSCLIKRHD